jgi:hypothetical protein
MLWGSTSPTFYHDNYSVTEFYKPIFSWIQYVVTEFYGVSSFDGLEYPLNSTVFDGPRLLYANYPVAGLCEPIFGWINRGVTAFYGVQWSSMYPVFC